MTAPCPSPSATGRPRFDVAEIFRAHGPAYRQGHSLDSEQQKAMWCIEHCRTEVLGGHLDVCAACGDRQPSYNSCRNRHCPKCQSLAQAAWLEKRKTRILPTHYFHVVFTIPHELNVLCRRNPRAMYDLLFAAASQTLLDFGRGELGAQLGVTAVLHTWTRDLRLHPHLHCVVTGGGLDGAQAKWVSTSKQFLFPVKALAKRFRGKLLAGLRALHAEGALDLQSTALADPKAFGRLVDALHRKAWVIYAKDPFGGPEQVFQYLGRYTHRVAISNARLVDVNADHVRFRTRDGGHAELAPDVFIGRFLLHVLPKGFVKIRHYGLMAAGNSTTKLEVARTLLTANGPDSPTQPTSSPVVLKRDWRAELLRLTGVDPSVCRRCGGMLYRQTLPRWGRRAISPSPAPQDSS